MSTVDVALTRDIAEGRSLRGKRVALLSIRKPKSAEFLSELGRVLAEDVISPVNVPSNDNSAMDGFALRFADLKADAEKVFETLGINTTEAIRMFLSQVRLRRGLPFSVGVPMNDDLLVSNPMRKSALDSVYDD